MIDLAEVADLFFEDSANGQEPAIVVIRDLSRVEDEPLFQRLSAEGHMFQFADETRLRELAWRGWEPVTERNEDGRRVIFTDRRKELVLVHRPNPH